MDRWVARDNRWNGEGERETHDRAGLQSKANRLDFYPDDCATSLRHTHLLHDIESHIPLRLCPKILEGEKRRLLRALEGIPTAPKPPKDPYPHTLSLSSPRGPASLMKILRPPLLGPTTYARPVSQITDPNHPMWKKPLESCISWLGGQWFLNYAGASGHTVFLGNAINPVHARPSSSQSPSHL